jgi:hypothetical protein
MSMMMMAHWSVNKTKVRIKTHVRLIKLQVRIRTYEHEDDGPLVCVNNQGQVRMRTYVRVVT